MQPEDYEILSHYEHLQALMQQDLCEMDHCIGGEIEEKYRRFMKEELAQLSMMIRLLYY